MGYISTILFVVAVALAFHFSSQGGEDPCPKPTHTVVIDAGSSGFGGSGEEPTTVCR